MLNSLPMENSHMNLKDSSKSIEPKTENMESVEERYGSNRTFVHTIAIESYRRSI